MRIFGQLLLVDNQKVPDLHKTISKVAMATIVTDI
jgi:hypothetical protein